MAKIMAKELGVSRIRLWEPSGQEVAAKQECFELAYWCVGEILDGWDTYKYPWIKEWNVDAKVWIKRKQN
jgi:hypothetical protein